MESHREIHVEVFGKTDVGLIREHNEDNFLVADVSNDLRTNDLKEPLTISVGAKGALFLVCDGMGGAAAGEVASQMAVDSIFGALAAAEPLPRDRFARLVRRAIENANDQIFAQSRDNQSERGMGTTCTAAALVDGTLVVGQIGDSRCYVIRGGTLAQVTKDQSLAWQLIEAGAMTVEEAKAFEHANIILQALGVQERVDVVLSQVDLRKGDVVLLCSDGLHGPVTDDELLGIIKNEPNLAKAGDLLIRKALERDGPDNVTLVLARFAGSALPAAGPGDVVTFVSYDPGRDPGDERPAPEIPPRSNATDSKATVEARVPDEILRMAANAGLRPVDAVPAAASASGRDPALDLRPRTSLWTIVLLAMAAAAAGGLFIKCDREVASRHESQIELP